MALKITTACEPIKVEHICLSIYSQPGLGKTSLAFTAESPLLLDFDKGAHRAVDRKDVVQVTDWEDVAQIRSEDIEGYQTIIIDTVGKALEVLTQDVIRTNSRHAYGGALNQQGWGQLGVRFGAFLRHLKGLGKDVVLIAHMDEQKDGDAIKERLKISGGFKDLVLTDSDVIARISIFNKERHLIFSPTEASFGKDPAQIGSMPIPEASAGAFKTCLADIISAVKENLNALSEAQVERKGEIEWFEQHLPNITDVEGINDVLGRAKKAGNDVARMVVARAEELGLEFDGDSRRYVYLEQFDPQLDNDVAKGDAEPGEAA